MKGKLKYFVAAFIIMDLLFVGQWAYNKYFLTPESTVDFIDYTLNEEEYFPDSFLPQQYGNLIGDHILQDVSNKPIELTKENRNFKYITIVQLVNTDIVDLDRLTEFINLKRDVGIPGMSFIYLIVGEFSESKIIELNALQDRFGIQIGSLTKEKLLEIFDLPDCRCGFKFMVDAGNRVRLSAFNIQYETVISIVEKELKIESLSENK